MNNNTVASPSMSVVKTPQIIITTDSNLFFQVFTNLTSFLWFHKENCLFRAKKEKGLLTPVSQAITNGIFLPQKPLYASYPTYSLLIREPVE